MMVLSQSASTAEKLLYGGQIALITMGVVFAVLAILCLLLLVFGAIFRKKNALKPSLKLPESAPVEVLPQQTPAPTSNDPIVAALTAAILAYRSGAGETGSFRVVSFRRHFE